MKKLLFFLLISISTFFIGLFSVSESYPIVSLADVTEDSEYYDGKTVEIITFARIYDLEDKKIIIGEPYEKPEAFTSLDLKENSINLDFLKNQLSENFSLNNYKRVKVRVIGKVYDNCNKGGTCCVGKTLKIITKSVTRTGQIEDYTIPFKFQLDESKLRLKYQN